jgi:hypothetical protein
MRLPLPRIALLLAALLAVLLLAGEVIAPRPSLSESAPPNDPPPGAPSPDVLAGAQTRPLNVEAHPGIDLPEEDDSVRVLGEVEETGWNWGLPVLAAVAVAGLAALFAGTRYQKAKP